MAIGHDEEAANSSESVIYYVFILGSFKRVNARVNCDGA